VPDYYDWDGREATPSQTTINPGATLRINSASIENAGPDTFDGVVNVNGGRLEVNAVPAWTLGPGGAMNLNSSGPAAVVDGATVEIRGAIDAVAGDNEILPAVVFQPSAAVTVNNPADTLKLSGPTAYYGGSYTGTGTIVQTGDAVVHEPTTVDVGTFDLDGAAEAAILSLDASLTLNVDQVDPADGAFDGTFDVATDEVTLTVNVPDRWVMNGLMNFAPPPSSRFRVAGGRMEHSGVVFSDGGSKTIFDADVFGPGVFTGTGEVVFNGSYNPGTSPGVGDFAGGVSFGDSAVLQIELGGQSSRQHDRLQVAGELALGGGLVISLIDGFEPEPGDEFDILDWGSLADPGFDNIVLPTPDSRKTWDLSQLYVHGVITVVSTRQLRLGRRPCPNRRSAPVNNTRTGGALFPLRNRRGIAQTPPLVTSPFATCQLPAVESIVLRS